MKPAYWRGLGIFLSVLSVLLYLFLLYFFVQQANIVEDEAFVKYGLTSTELCATWRVNLTRNVLLDCSHQEPPNPDCLRNISWSCPYSFDLEAWHTVVILFLLLGWLIPYILIVLIWSQFSCIAQKSGCHQYCVACCKCCCWNKQNRHTINIVAHAYMPVDTQAKDDDDTP